MASERCAKLARLSEFSVAFLTVEVIGLNLADLTGLLVNVNPTLIPSATLLLSIAILVFVIFENTKEFKLKSKGYHNSGLEINKLYNELKIAIANNDQENFNNQTVLTELNDQFEKSLNQYDNHDVIDFRSFVLDRWEDFGLSWFQRWEIRFQTYLETKLLYHALIAAGPVAVIVWHVVNLK